MTQTAAEEVQAAIYEKLSPSEIIDSTLAGAGWTGIFDIRDVPQGQAFDYVTLGDCIQTPKNTLGRRGYLLHFTIHLWSRQYGTSFTNIAIARINELIDQQPLTLATQTHVYTMFDQSQSTPDPDGLTLHTTLSYMIYTEE